MRVGLVHGVATSNPEGVGDMAERALRANGIPADVTMLDWPSSGRFAADVARFATLRNFSRDAEENVIDGVREFAREGRGVLVGHSMGTVLLIQAERFLRTGLPILCIASPLSNSLVRPQLTLIGYGRPPPTPVIHLWNHDDPICWPGDQPSYFQATRIAVPGNDTMGADSEHDLELYLRHPHTHNALRLLDSRR